jgi:hypothetical protein
VNDKLAELASELLHIRAMQVLYLEEFIIAKKLYDSTEFKFLKYHQ